MCKCKYVYMNEYMYVQMYEFKFANMYIRKYVYVENEYVYMQCVDM